MDWDLVWTTVITGVGALIVGVLGRLISRNDDPEQVLDPKWAEIVDILPISELKWLSFHLDLGLQQPHGHGGLIEHMEFFSLVRKVLYMREVEERREEAKKAPPPNIIEQFQAVDNGVGWVDPNRRLQEWASYTERDREYGKTLNEKRSA